MENKTQRDKTTDNARHIMAGENMTENIEVMKACLNNQPLQNENGRGGCLISSGREFHNLGATPEKYSHLTSDRDGILL